MNNFTILLEELEGIKEESRVNNAILRYLRRSDEKSALAGISLLLGYKQKKLVSPEKLKELTLIYTGYPEYLFEESIDITGDLIETASLITGTSEADCPLLLNDLVRIKLPQLQSYQDTAQQQNEIFQLWKLLPAKEKLFFNRLITGKFRSPVDEHYAVKALAEHFGMSIKKTYIMLENHHADRELLSADLFKVNAPNTNVNAGDTLFSPRQINDVNEIDFKNNTWYTRPWGVGLRVMLESGDSGVYLWSEEQRLLNKYFPEIISAGKGLRPGTTLEGELIAEKTVESSSVLEKRLRSKNPVQKAIAENKILLSVTDCIVFNGKDVTKSSSIERLHLAEQVVSRVGGDCMLFEHCRKANNTGEVNEYLNGAVNAGAKGLLLQLSTSIYGDGFLLKQENKTLNVVLMYAQQGKGNYTGIYSEYSWGIRKDEGYVVIARSNEGLTEEEILRLDKFVKEKRTERFGPVAVVPPEIWAEITYERQEVSKRHKAGVVLRNISRVKLIKN